MAFNHFEEAVHHLEKGNAELEPELLHHEVARDLLVSLSKARRLVDFAIASVTRKVDDAVEVAKVTGTSFGKAKETVQTGKVLQDSEDLSMAFQLGKVSLDQASDIAKAEQSAPGIARKLISIAERETFQVLKDEVRKEVLEAEQHKDLATRQHTARSARSHVDHLGMVNINLRLEPHVGAPLVNRAEAEAKRFAKKAHSEGRKESFECHLADAYAKMLAGTGKASTTRPELVVLVSHSVVKRGWKDVRKGEFCKIPGVGPVSPQFAKEIAQDALLTGIFYDGKDLRQMKRWTKYIPKEIRIALELGDPPDFDGMKCARCGTRVGNEIDHIKPRAARGPTAKPNLEPKCRMGCHPEKTERDRKAGKYKRRAP